MAGINKFLNQTLDALSEVLVVVNLCAKTKPAVEAHLYGAVLSSVVGVRLGCEQTK